MAEKGTDHWWSGPIEDFVPPSLEGKWLRGRDTLDVWFDSGSSWTMLDQRADPSEPLADVYLEGSDQHRGWFQSSLLTSLTKSDSAPFRHLITHGFVLDEEGQKMSKSASNGISPMDVVEGSKVRYITGSFADGSLNLHWAPIRFASGQHRWTIPETSRLAHPR